MKHFSPHSLVFRSISACALLFTQLVPVAAMNDNTATSTQSTEIHSTKSECPAFLNHEYRLLHSSKTINLCSLYTGKPMLIVNTASHCGFTSQFGGLESLYSNYGDKGLVVVGFASNDFMQESKDEAKAASICYENFGVSFTMMAPSKVRGKKANPTFQHLAAETKKPAWNFNKYLITEKGAKVRHFGSRTKPLGSELEEQIKVAFSDPNNA